MPFGARGWEAFFLFLPAFLCGKNQGYGNTMSCECVCLPRDLKRMTAVFYISLLLVFPCD